MWAAQKSKTVGFLFQEKLKKIKDELDGTKKQVDNIEAHVVNPDDIASPKERDQNKKETKQHKNPIDEVNEESEELNDKQDQKARKADVPKLPKIMLSQSNSWPDNPGLNTTSRMNRNTKPLSKRLDTGSNLNSGKSQSMKSLSSDKTDLSVKDKYFLKLQLAQARARFPSLTL